MTQSEKLEALVQKATDNGLVTPLFSWISEDCQALLDYWLTNDNYKAIIFNHDFAKALFGEDKMFYGVMELGAEEPDLLRANYRQDRWFTLKDVKKYKPVKYYWSQELSVFEYHLQQAVISPDPIDYLYKAVFKQ